MKDALCSGRLENAERAEFLPFVCELAAVSAAVIRPYCLHGTAVETKGDDTPVTAADRRAEEVMRLLIMQRYADHGICSPAATPCCTARCCAY